MHWEPWFENKTFSADWTSGNFSVWTQVLKPLREKDVRVLEIGSWEGRSAIFFLEFLPRSRLTCIDTFAGSPEYQPDGKGVSGTEAHFDSNLACYGDRVEKIKSRSLPALDNLAQSGRSFDLIYIDGSHARDEVMLDSVLAWRLLEANGICIWDDYKLDIDVRPSALRPQHAIEAFLDMHAGEFELLHSAYQVIVRKNQGDPAEGGNLLVFRRTPRNLFRFLTRRPMLR